MNDLIGLIEALPGIIAIAIVFFLLVLFLLWVLLPFAVVGTNKRLTKLIEINERIARSLEANSSREAAWRAQDKRKEPTISKEPSTTPDTTITCPKCEKLLPAGAEFCNRCGGMVSQET